MSMISYKFLKETLWSDQHSHIGYVVYPRAGFLKPTADSQWNVGNVVNGKSTLIGAFLNLGKST
jgi:hypothetical protein